MLNTCRKVVGSAAIRVTPLALALAAIFAVSPVADAASIGHSRLVSASGQPLSINVPIRQLSDADLQSLRVSAAPASAWQQAGLVPPVELSSLRFNIEQGFTPDSRVVQVRSNQLFDGPVADLLLQVDTAMGSQQYQVSLLAQSAQPGVTAATQTSAGSAVSTQAAGVGGAAPTTSRTISVRRGDTLFALARANAVEGVTVYQMMIALQKANPQAFIDSNINLVKAGATLAIPSAAALREISDREARRLFQQQAQAFAAYRDGVAARSTDAVQGGSAQQGVVSDAPAAVTVASAAATGDQVVLSSGNPQDAVRDSDDATRRNIDESQTRVAQLERNVQSLNQALQLQGEAAKEAVVGGAAAVSQTISEAASSLGMSGDAAVDGPAAEGAGPEAGSVQAGSDADALDQAAPGRDASAAMAGGEQASTGDGASGAVSDSGAVAGGQQPGAGLADTTAEPAQSDSNSSSKAEQPVSWIQENMLGVITAVLALVVLIIAWLLRRAAAMRSGDGQGGVTEAMVQERLEKIDFDLETPPANQRPPHNT